MTAVVPPRRPRSVRPGVVLVAVVVVAPRAAAAGPDPQHDLGSCQRALRRPLTTTHAAGAARRARTLRRTRAAPCRRGAGTGARTPGSGRLPARPRAVAA